jgi:Mrp family chromosome partitioning ATPase
MNAIAEYAGVRAEEISAVPQRDASCEYYDAILRRLQTASNGSPSPRVIGLTACARGAGVSTIAANLAIRAADRGHDGVLLVDANVSHPAQGRNFRLGSGPGLTNVASRRAALADCVAPSAIPRLSILPAGNSSLEFGAETSTCIQDLRNQYRLIVMDLPPADDLSPFWELSREVDGIVLVIEAEKTRSGAAQQVRRQLEECHVPLLGVILNKRRTYLPGWLYRWL